MWPADVGPGSLLKNFSSAVKKSRLVSGLKSIQGAVVFAMYDADPPPSIKFAFKLTHAFCMAGCIEQLYKVLVIVDIVVRAT